MTAETPLNKLETDFVTAYMQSESGKAAVLKMIEAGTTNTTPKNAGARANSLLARPNVKAEIERRQQQLLDKAVADGAEVMRYLTAVMRGEITDQFGLDAPLAERTNAAKELAKRTVDIENRRNGEYDQTIKITLDWRRPK